MGYQFIHIEAYSRVGSQQKDKAKRSASDIAGEAERLDGYCNHVSNPKAPAILHGVSPSEAVKQATAWAETVKDSIGRGLRKDGLCLLAGVVSISNDDASSWKEHRDRSVNWLKAKFGDRLISVIEHTDETHPHIHFYCVPKPGEKFSELHPGHKASSQVKDIKSKQNAAFIEAMRQFQDDFHNDVASKVGLARRGPGKRRLTRSAWKAEQAEYKAIANTRRSANKSVQKANKQLKEINNQMAKAATAGQVWGSMARGVVQGLTGGPTRAQKLVADTEARVRAEEALKRRSLEDERNSYKIAYHKIAEELNFAIEKNVKKREKTADTDEQKKEDLSTVLARLTEAKKQAMELEQTQEKAQALAVEPSQIKTIRPKLR